MSTASPVRWAEMSREEKHILRQVARSVGAQVVIETNNIHLQF